LLAAADVLVTNSSATGVEAIALGVVPIFFHNPHLYDLSILHSLQDSALFATDASELVQALDDALSGRAARRLAPHWDDDLRRLFGSLDTAAEERLLTFMRESETEMPVPSNAFA
jgi:predicted glycosyltransferase